MDAQILDALAAWRLKSRPLGDDEAAFVDGFMAGFEIGEATAWRRITDDSDTWPPTGMWVVLWDVTEDVSAIVQWDPKRIALMWTHWCPINPPERDTLPIPEPPTAA